MNIEIAAEKVLASGPDSQVPMGVRVSNVRCPRWNQLVFALLAPNYSRPLRVLDLGCAGGGWVKDCMDWGHIAVGVEGSDWCKEHKNGEWGVIPDRLFTADISREVTIYEDNKLMQFDLITCFEVLEHLKECELVGMLDNVSKHLDKKGLFICSVNPNRDDRNGVSYHQTVWTEAQWTDWLSQQGYYRLRNIEKYFSGHYLRGPKHPISGGIGMVLSQYPNVAPVPPPKGIAHWLLDHWLGSFPQRCLQYALIGPSNENR